MLSLVAASLGYTSQMVEVASDASPDNWAVLVAGSSGYGNYRHQADVCHAYHVMRNGGVPASNIIVLAVDDIANYRSNPYPGQIFNKPTPAGTPGVDVYKGCKIDYSGSKVTPEIFTKVMTGDKSAGGKVLESGPNSHVFLNFVDHGGVNLIGFPRTTMHAKELIAALTTMHEKKLYKELVFYLEACESGSMFATLPTDINIYATSASNAKESSWGTYCSPDDKVNGKSIRSCLGDLYSVNWMEDSDKLKQEDAETLDLQFEAVKKLTTKSHVTKFGDSSMGSEKVNDYLGPGYEARTSSTLSTNADGKEVVSRPSYDASLSSSFERFLAGEEEAGDELIQAVQQRAGAKRRFSAIAKAVSGKSLGELPPYENGQHLDCHYVAYKAYIATCGEFDAGSTAYSAALAQLCQHNEGSPDAIVTAITAACA
jgi:legumain